jgi:putative SOS response-associated peptidase YedK
MCGRYASARSVDDIAGAFGIADPDIEAMPAADWNIAPTKPVPAVLVRDRRPCLTTLRWGLVPAWSASPSAGATLFNARIETVADKPAFRDAVRRRRCLLPADGWYEWMRMPDGARVPHFLSAPDGGLVALAGIWESWRDAEGRELTSTAILTGAAPPDLAAVHDRAPVVLPPSDWARWLDAAAGEADVRALLRPTPEGAVHAWPVGDAVGDVRANGPGLAAPIRLNEQPTLF